MSQIPLEQDEGAMGRPLAAGAILLSEKDLQRAAQQLDPAQSLEERWARFLRLLSLQALKRWLGERKPSVVVGPELNPEDPDRLLALNGLATQLLCVSPLADVVEVPLIHWRKTATAPQLLLLAQVDEDAGLVHFPGVLDARAFVAEVMRVKASHKDAVDLPLALFQGGLERMARWVSLLEKEALPRVGLSSSGDGSPWITGLQEWISGLLDDPGLVPIPVRGTRGPALRGLNQGAVREVRLITPQVIAPVDGTVTAHVYCSTPSIWADTPLTEILLLDEGENVLKQLLVTEEMPIRGPVLWPLEPLQPHQKITMKLRRYRAPGGAYAELSIVAPNAAEMGFGDQVIAKAVKEFSLERSLKKLMFPEDKALAGEIAARVWLLYSEENAGGLDNDSQSR
jgi:hypothetical protein